MKTKITNIGSIVAWSPEEDKLLTLPNVEILVQDSTIVHISKTVGDAEEEIDADGALITPGFVDSHTHPIFSGNRANEFGMRVSGKSYEEIADRGGGIISSINGVRNASEDQLFEECLERVNFFLVHGTTTIEAKSGYGLTVEDELKSLRVIKRLNESSPLDIIPTFMGAHDFPPEFKNDKSGYVQLICDEMIPAVAEENLADFCDVFCEDGYFSIKDSRRILETAQKHGLTPRLHADEFVDSGAAELAADVGAVSADHLMAVSDEGIQKLAENRTIATLLPGTTFFLGKSGYAPYLKLIEAGVDVALATDFNPGSCYIQSMPFILSLSCIYLKMPILDAIMAATFTSAKSLQLENEVGSIEIGKKADILVWNIERTVQIPFLIADHSIQSIIKNGSIVP